MPLDRTQIGRAGELALALYAMVTASGELELFTPVSDDDHVDVTAGRRGGMPRLALQVKTAPALDRDGLVEARAEYPSGRVREHPAFLYAVLWLPAVSIEAAWIVPSPDFNRLAYHSEVRGRVALELRADPHREDRWTPFQVAPAELGPHLMNVADALGGPIPAAFLAEHGGLVVLASRR